MPPTAKNLYATTERIVVLIRMFHWQTIVEQGTKDSYEKFNLATAEPKGELTSWPQQVVDALVSWDRRTSPSLQDIESKIFTVMTTDPYEPGTLFAAGPGVPVPSFGSPLPWPDWPVDPSHLDLAAAAVLMAEIPGPVVASSLDTASSAFHRECPWCAESIKVAAKVCRYCGRDVPLLETPMSGAQHPSSLPPPPGSVRDAPASEVASSDAVSVPAAAPVQARGSVTPATSGSQFGPVTALPRKRRHSRGTVLLGLLACGILAAVIVIWSGSEQGPKKVSSAETTLVTPTTGPGTSTTSAATSTTPTSGPPPQFLSLEKWSPVNVTIQAGPDDGAFTLVGGSTDTAYGAVLIDPSPTLGCDYTFEADARILDPASAGWGIVARAGANGATFYGNGIEYHYQESGLRDMRYSNSVASQVVMAVDRVTDLEWHHLSITVEDSSYLEEFDGELVFSGQTDSPCGFVFLRVWSPGAVEFRGVTLSSR
jgi:hypothetical protein